MAIDWEARIKRNMEAARKLDPNFWRHPLAEATVALLEAGQPVTVSSLISRLEAFGDGPEELMRREISEAAIERLRKIVVE
ncbi:hypothetical protein GGR23_003456 [Gellertiella hungarica]|uniref:Uncharacterized protein n=1 Tax=Gellertiella hungarica TaxID=1572859 RepID=A0A7W6J7H8_9HYPH|nr:hypothetical protein [Gellertiella hungarica]